MICCDSWVSHGRLTLIPLSPDQYTVIGEKVTYRLAQRPGSYMVLKYNRPVIKRLDTQAI